MKKIILDTNFLMILGQFKIDIISEIDSLLDEPHEIFITPSVRKELERLAERKSKDGGNAVLALRLIENKKIKMMDVRGSVDDSLVKAADKDWIVGTNDIELRKRLKNKGIKTIYLRAKKHLAIG